MSIDLAYIDDTLNRLIEDDNLARNIPPAARDLARKKGQAIVAGFRVFDEDAEKAELDRMIAERVKGIKAFQADRKTICDKLGDVGVTPPLGVVPSKAWTAICKKAGLFLLAPDKRGKVQYRYGCFARLSEKDVVKMPRPELFAKMFPDQESPDHGSAYATLVLPEPPKDVAAILLKVKDFSLKVAAVMEAIGFVETREELYRGQIDPRDAWAQVQGYADYADWVRRNPIIYTEYGSAAAIIAQFGDFPIEKAVVDAVVETGDLFPDRIDAVTTATLTTSRTINDTYAQAVRQSILSQHGNQFLGALGLGQQASINPPSNQGVSFGGVSLSPSPRPPSIFGLTTE